MITQPKNENPLVSVCLITYNHETFIKDAFDGIINQKTNFPIEIIVSDDCSKDKTIEIIQSYKDRYSTLVTVLKNETNVGMHKNWERAIRACKGKYIALLEGDDYWIDPLKLQKQIEILEADETLAISCTNAKVELVGADKKHPDYVLKKEGRYSLKELIQEAFMPTCTVVFRNGLLPTILPKCFYTAPMADFPIHLLNTLKGDIFYLDTTTSTYRLHGYGEWGKLNDIGRLNHILGGLVCAQKILSNTIYSLDVKKVKKNTLFKISHFYKNRNSIAKYIYYRIRTRLAI